MGDLMVLLAEMGVPKRAVLRGGGNDAFGLGQPFSDHLWNNHRVPGTALHSLFPDQPGAVDLLSGRDM